MGLQLSWDNTALLANPNTLAVRALQRLKIIGGTFYTTGFLPANDLAPSLIATEFTGYLVNKVYEFKIETICTAGGPTENTNGVQEGIVFECITPEVVAVISESDSYSTTIDLTGLDIEGVIYTLKRQDDSSIVSGPTDVPKVANFSQIDYTGLTPETDYYIEALLYATINGVVTEFSCGGNITGYQFTTIAAP